MIHVAKEMERQGLKIPLLIGGATTSKYGLFLSFIFCCCCCCFLPLVSFFYFFLITFSFPYFSCAGLLFLLSFCFNLLPFLSFPFLCSFFLPPFFLASLPIFFPVYAQLITSPSVTPLYLLLISYISLFSFISQNTHRCEDRATIQ